MILQRLIRLAGLTALLAAALIIPGTDPVRAGEIEQGAGAIQMDVRVGFDGYVQSSTWTPVFITVSNAGEDISGELRVDVRPFTGAETIYSRAVELPRGSRKQVTLYIADLSSFNSEIEVRLFSNRSLVASQQVKADIVDQYTLLIGLWSDTPQQVSGLALALPSGGKTRVALLTGDDLPELARALEALDVFVIANADTGVLSIGQQEALRLWVLGGGKLVILGGLNYQRTLAGISDLLPVEVNGTESVSLEPLATFTGISYDPQQLEAVVSSSVVLPGSQVLVESRDIPLLVRQQVGNGQVIFLAPDAGLAPFSSWTDEADIWVSVLSQGYARPVWGYGFYQNWEAARQAVASVPGVSLPGVIQLCGFMALYIILIGPVNYIVLTRLKKRELAWFTIPVLVLLFSGVAYVTGFQVRGSRAILHRLAIVQSWEGDDMARIDGLLGVWSPRRSRYDLSLDPGLSARPIPRDVGGLSINAVQVAQSDRFSLEDVRVDVGSVQSYVVEGYVAAAPDISSDLALVAYDDGLHLEGMIRNDSDLDFVDAAVVVGGYAVGIGNLPSGEQQEIDVLVSGGNASASPGSSLDPFPAESGYYYYYYDDFHTTITSGDCYSTQSQRRRCSLFEAIRISQGTGMGVFLFGWVEQVPMPVTVAGRQADTVDLGLYIVQMDISLAIDEEGLSLIPPGLMTWQSLETDTYYSYVTPYELYMYSGEFYAFRYEPLPFVPFSEVAAMTIHLEKMYEYDENVGTPVVRIYNYDTGEWDLIPGLGWGNTMLTEVDPYVDASGAVQLRIFGGTSAYSTSIGRLDVSYHTASTTEQ